MNGPVRMASRPNPAPLISYHLGSKRNNVAQDFE